MEETDRRAARSYSRDRQKVDLFNIGARNDLLKPNVREITRSLFQEGIYRIKCSFLLTKYPPRDVP